MIRSLVDRYRKRKEASLLPVKKAILGSQQMIGIDVGSAGGLQPHWRAFEGVVDFFLFEPHQDSYEKLKAHFSSSPYMQRFHILPIGLSESGGERTLYKLNCPTGSSLYPVNELSEFSDPDNSYVYPLTEERIQTRNLDDVLNEKNVSKADIIKLDVQGAELEILRGLGTSRMKNLLLAEVEVNISTGVEKNIGPYAGAPSWGEIDHVMASSGMRLLDVSVAREYRSKAGDSDWYQRNIFDVYTNTTSLSARVWEADVVYVRDWRQLVAEKDGGAIRKLIVALCGYRFFSEAYFTVEQSEKAGIFDAAAASEIKLNIVEWHRARRHFWHGRGLVPSAFRRILRTLRISQMLRWKQYMWFEYPNG